MLTMLTLLFHAGCKKDDLHIREFDRPPGTNLMTFSEVDEELRDSLLHIFAKSLAVAQTDATFRQYL